MNWWAAVGKVLAAVLGSFLDRWRRDKEKIEEGRQDVMEEAHDEADKRSDEAKALDAEWDRMSPAERERVRNDQGHYRD